MGGGFQLEEGLGVESRVPYVFLKGVEERCVYVAKYKLTRAVSQKAVSGHGDNGMTACG